MNQILQLEEEIAKKYNYFLITEKSEITKKIRKNNIYFLLMVNRKELFVFFKMLINCINSIWLIYKLRPIIIISTGALSTLPFCILGKFYGAKLIYIESFSKSSSPTISGKVLYKFANLFLVQQKPMLEFYPNGIFEGSLI